MTAPWQANIDEAHRQLVLAGNPSHETVRHVLLKHAGVDIDVREGDDADDEQPVVLARGQLERVTCQAALTALTALTDPGDAQVPKWVQIAQAGVYKGYAGGAFTFDDKIFGQIIANFHRHPAYDGRSGVIPWDFEHASASFAADGSIPITGTPAQGWICELQTQPGPAGTRLMALTNWLEPARSYILAGRYKWASVVVQFDSRDPRTGLNVGATIESVALTNGPFIQGMQPVAASRNGAKPPSKGQKMSAQLSKQNGVLTLKLAAEVGPSTSGYSSGGVDPAWNNLPNLDQTFFQEVLSKAKAIPGFENQSPESIASWLRALDKADVLGLADRTRCAILVGQLIKQVVEIARPVGAGVSPVTPLLPTELSRLDARSFAGRNRVERACLAMRASQPGFGSLPFEQQVALAGDAIKSGRVIA